MSDRRAHALTRAAAAVVGRVMRARVPFWFRMAVAASIGRLVAGTPVRSRYDVRVVANVRDRTNRAALTGSRNLDVVMHAIAGIRTAECFMDIGANLGICSLVAARQTGAAGLVVAFEPQPRVFADLQRNLELNARKDVIALCVAIDRTAHESDLVDLHLSHTGLATLRHAGSTAAAGPPVTCVTFEQVPFLEPLIGARTIVAKVDVEGCEIRVLQALAAAPFVPQVRMMIVEVNEALLARFGGSRTELMAAAEAMGFRATRFGPQPHYDEVFVRVDHGQVSVGGSDDSGRPERPAAPAGVPPATSA
jgi:FkbM family methyltransferase